MELSTMTLLALPTNSKFDFNGRKGVIEAVNSKYVVLDFEDCGPKVVLPHELQDAYIKGEFTLEKPKTEFVLEAVTDPSYEQKYAYVNEVVQTMRASKTPQAKAVLERAAANATKKYGLFNGKIPSNATFKRWYKRWEENEFSVAYVLGKTKEKRRSQFNLRVKDLADEVIHREYLKFQGDSRNGTYYKFIEEYSERVGIWEKENRKDVYKTEEELALKPMSRSTFLEYLAKLDPYEVDKARLGVKAARKIHRSVKSSFVTNRPLELVEVDAVHLNIAVINIDEKGNELLLRPILYIAIDVHTRLIVGFTISYGDKNSSESSSAVIQLIKEICNPVKVGRHTSVEFPLGGIPETVVSDSGPAFTASQVKAMLSSNGISAVVTEKASPWKKPFVERFMRTLKTQCMANIDGYAGVRQRGAELDRTIEEMAHLSCEEFETAIEKYILSIYHRNPHRGLDNETPIEAWEEVANFCAPRIAADFSMIDAFRGLRAERTISTPKGIVVNGIYYNNNELQKLGHQLERQFKNRSVELMHDDLDIGEITVINPLTQGIIIVPATTPKVFKGLSLAEFKPQSTTDKTRNRLTMLRIVAGSGPKPKKKKRLQDTHDITKALTHDEVEKAMHSGIGKHSDNPTPSYEETSVASDKASNAPVFKPKPSERL